MWTSSAIPYFSLFCHQQTHTVIFMFFSGTMHYTSNAYFYIVSSTFPFLFNWSQSKASVVNQMSHLSFEAQKYFFAVFNFSENGHIHNVVSLVINVMKLDVENNSIVSTLYNVVNINAEVDNVDLTLFNVGNFNVDVRNVVSTLIWHCSTSRRHT